MYLDESGEIAQWVIRAFAGEGTERVVYWDRSPATVGEAENYVREDGCHAIRIGRNWRHGEHRGQRKPGEVVPAHLIFELMNARNQQAFAELHAAAKAGGIDRETYLLECVRIERRAAQRQRAFYVRFVLPWAEDRGLRTHPRWWYLTYWLTAEQYMAQLAPDEDAYPWFPFGLHFDCAVLERQVEMRDFDGALRTCKRLLKRAPAEQLPGSTLGPAMLRGHGPHQRRDRLPDQGPPPPAPRP